MDLANCAEVIPVGPATPAPDYNGWQREKPMELWQLDIVCGIRLVNGIEAKVVAGAKAILTNSGVRSLLIETNTNLAEHRNMVHALTDLGFKYDPVQVHQANKCHSQEKARGSLRWVDVKLLAGIWRVNPNGHARRIARRAFTSLLNRKGRDSTAGSRR